MGLPPVSRSRSISASAPLLALESIMKGSACHAGPPEGGRSTRGPAGIALDALSLNNYERQLMVRAIHRRMMAALRRYGARSKQ